MGQLPILLQKAENIIPSQGKLLPTERQFEPIAQARFYRTPCTGEQHNMIGSEKNICEGEWVRYSLTRGFDYVDEYITGVHAKCVSSASASSHSHPICLRTCLA